ncbi:TPA: hypothetical protein ACT5CR_003753 [Burkholderia cenocepacia]|uniref:Uncharacterized protein n=3 Tax=Burkholderia cepacia complex TaxID=87882 RepID=A0ABD7LFK1_9BURK|nr:MULTISPECIES: hypothetical protein [Burkholderia cepacia complex]MDR8731758.1 hypothetical protein [Burkholderia pseudomultivorans]MDR8736164.1 hypothetical protein [Burkholderia pseudomultivorans]MDR8742424.1 hypothetical protein [Burkholderia pseudomultivorans]MDR8755507.1 hypothetical protein [Burkholderia pseudomultivorans]MDR8779255.1 hypothetical protein [Burkholderia pseudomultivorans]
MKTSKVIREIASEIENIFRNNELAEPNPLALAQLEALHSRMRLHCGYCFERTTKIISLAKDFYSVRKHQLHPGGADGVLRDVCVNLEEMRAWASLWEKNGK